MKLHKIFLTADCRTICQNERREKRIFFTKARYCFRERVFLSPTRLSICKYFAFCKGFETDKIFPLCPETLSWEPPECKIGWKNGEFPGVKLMRGNFESAIFVPKWFAPSTASFSRNLPTILEWCFTAVRTWPQRFIIHLEFQLSPHHVRKSATKDWFFQTRESLSLIDASSINQLMLVVSFKKMKTSDLARIDERQGASTIKIFTEKLRRHSTKSLPKL